jgi:TatD DNase family protein
MVNHLFDIGANLTDASFDADRSEVIERAVATGVTAMVVTGSSIRHSQAALDMAHHNTQTIYATAGVHPHNARQCDKETLNILRRLTQDKKVVALGECGLDFNRNFSPPADQERWFDAQVALACELKIPLFLHERDAHERFLAILNKFKGGLPPVVVHCFTGTVAEMEKYLEAGFHIGITGWICDERRGLHLREVARRMPLNRLMLETDAPYLTPRNMEHRPRNGRNEPAFLIYVLSAVAKAMQKSEAEVAAATTATARAFFKI